MTERYRTGVLDTCTYVDLDVLSPGDLPVIPALTAVTLAELQQGVALARDPAVRAARMEKLGAAVADFEPLPFDGDAAARYGTLVALVMAAGRDPRPRRLDLMIASVASVGGLPLYTRNADDFKGLEGALTVVGV
ncbi:type II toxin-antitoxin system VapC family toxin [Streptomyces sp. NBC_01217]|uniref:type II toxin-antitoxin system VapC family toxin n=1 Tax=Streptomyces sp. NBC_01217 TaxID=2903779 RepID=UPI002E105FEE|nr:type II toxin-antitoxin system VapC family toxin [Streptomyces sp. NBC_01217]